MEIVTHSALANIHRVKILDSASTVGAGKTGLTSASSGLIVSTIADNEATATAYTGANLETITTLGTYAAPTSGKARFKEVDATNHPGLYEIQLANARYAVVDAKTLTITVSGASGAAQVDKLIELKRLDLQTALPAGFVNLTGGLIAAAVWDENIAGFHEGAGSAGFLLLTVKDNSDDIITTVGVAGAGLTSVSVGANGINSSSIAATTFNASHFATSAITADVIAANAIGASELAADAVAEIVAGIVATGGLSAAQDAKLTNVDTAANRFLTMIALDGSVYQFTANAMELAPSATLQSITLEFENTSSNVEP